MKSKIGILVKIEIQKLLKQRFILFLFLFLIVIQFLWALLRNQLPGIQSLGILEANGFQIISFCSSWTLKFAPMLMIVSVMLLSTENSYGTLKTILTRPVSRTEFIYSKIISILLIVIVSVLIIALFGFLIGITFFGLQDITEGGYVLYSWQKILVNFLIAYVLSILPLFVLCLFGFFISTLIKETGAAIGSSIGIYLLIWIISQYEPISKFLFNAYLTFPFDIAGDMAKGLTVSWGPGIYFLILNTFVYGILFVGLSIVNFNRKDLLV